MFAFGIRQKECNRLLYIVLEYLSNEKTHFFVVLIRNDIYRYTGAD